MSYLRELLPNAAKTFIVMIGIFAVIIFASYSFNALGEVAGIGPMGGQLIGLISILITGSLLMAHADLRLKAGKDKDVGP